MATRYNPIVDHEPFESEELEAVEVALNSKLGMIRDHFRRHDKPLDDDELAFLIEELTEILVRFVLTCKALPLRSPNQLAATIKRIAKHPHAFLANMGTYDPEAEARVIAVYCRDPAAKKLFVEFERGSGAPPLVQDIVKAAEQALQETARAKNKAGGRPGDELQRTLALEIARIYENFGGSLGRRVHATEYGPFHEFLEIVLPVVQGHAIQAKSSLTVARMARIARTASKA